MYKNKRQPNIKSAAKTCNITTTHALTKRNILDPLRGIIKKLNEYIMLSKDTHPFDIDLKTYKELEHFEKQNINIAQHIPDNYKIQSVIGKGVYGTVFSIRDNEFNFRAIKVQQFFNRDESLEFIHEYEMQKVFYKAELAPKVYSITPYALRYGIIEMDMINGTIGDILVREWVDEEIVKEILNWIYSILYLLTRHKLVHGDLHWKNVGYIVYEKDEKYYIRVTPIDFGFARRVKNDENCISLEISQLIRTINAPDFKNISTNNKDIIVQGLYKKYIESVGIPEIFKSAPPSTTAIIIYMTDLYKEFCHDYLLNSDIA